MEKYLTLLIVAGAAFVVVGGVFAIYQLFQLVKTDAVCRGLKHPKLWGLFSISGNNSAGLLLYLINRRKHPIISMTDEQKIFTEICKKKIGVGIIFQVIGVMACIWGIILLPF